MRCKSAVTASTRTCDDAYRDSVVHIMNGEAFVAAARCKHNLFIIYADAHTPTRSWEYTVLLGG